MDIKAQQKYLVTSPRKLREVVSLIKDLPPLEAVEKLPFSGKRASESLRKVIMTAVANAKQKDVDENTLIFKEIQINEGPRLKRWRPGARGRAKPYKRRMSHIRVVLTTRSDQIPSSKSQIKTESKEVKSKTKTSKDKKNA